MNFQDDPALAELYGADVSAQQQAKKLTQREYDQLLTSFGDVFDTEAGKRVLWFILSECHIYQTSFTGNSTTFFREGERQIGLKVLGKMLEARPDGLQALVDFKRKENPNG